MTAAVVQGATASSVQAVLPDLPEPLPERIVHGYLNDELASECLRADFFFTPACRWCSTPFTKHGRMFFVCQECDVTTKQ